MLLTNATRRLVIQPTIQAKDDIETRPTAIGTARKKKFHSKNSKQANIEIMFVTANWALGNVNCASRRKKIQPNQNGPDETQFKLFLEQLNQIKANMATTNKVFDRSVGQAEKGQRRNRQINLQDRDS